MTRVEPIGAVEGGASLIVALRLAGKRVLVVGGGTVATQRVQRVLEADASVLVVAPRLNAALRARWSQGEIDWRPAAFHPDDLDGVELVLTAIDDEEESRVIAEAARARRILVNAADIPDACDIWFTAQHRDGPLQVAISSNGTGPALSARLAREVRAALPAAAGGALRAFGVLRKAVRQADPAPTSSSRRMGWLTKLARAWTWDALAAMDEGTVSRLVDHYLSGDEPPEPQREPVVTLVGAGPGDPSLLTMRATEALRQADLVLADRLVPTAITDLVQGELRVARKPRGRAERGQEELYRWLLEGVRAGRRVVRLKCGDPFVFGRGGEEVQRLAEHGIATEVVPGISSALAAPLAAGIPTTLRGFADRLLVLTAQGRQETTPTPPDFEASTTYVYLMGVKRLPSLVPELLAAGWPPDWPAAIVERASHPGERSLVGTLAMLPQLAADNDVKPPAVVVIGRVVDARTAEVAAVPVPRAVAAG
jgi:uroporphyrin-III C-methyltransferase